MALSISDTKITPPQETPILTIPSISPPETPVEILTDDGNAISPTLSHPILPGEVFRTFPRGVIGEVTVDSAMTTPREVVEARPQIWHDDRKAIIDALSRRTKSGDLMLNETTLSVEPQKCVSETEGGRTSTDHSKDSEPITSVERQDLIDAIGRNSDFPVLHQVPSSIPVRYSDPWPITNMSKPDERGSEKMSKPDEGANEETSKPDEGASEEMSQPHETVSAELIIDPTITSPTSKTLPKLKLHGTLPTLFEEEISERETKFLHEEQPTMSIEDREAITSTIARKKVSQDGTMEVLPQPRKYVSETLARKTITNHSKDDEPISSLERKGLVDAASRRTVVQSEMETTSTTFEPQVSPKLMPFSKKERRELVRSISMQIKEPEKPLWDMDLMDIREAEEAEKAKKSSPEPFEPTFGFDEPIRLKAPLRKSKRHRIVRVHATDYARAHAVEVQEFCSNKIKSTKYSIMTFIPVNLFLQCTRAANLYFILIASLQLIPNFSPTSWGTTVVPLVLVLFLNMVKEGIDEFKRGVSERRVNKQKVEVLNENSFFVTTWSSVIVGDIVRVKSDQEFPADLVFLSSADSKGLAYVETANLDGETNLKIRNAFYRGLSTMQEEDETPLSIFSGLTIECELPNNRLYKFEGAMNLQDYGQLPLDTRQILLRGATLRNTEWILGVVVYTGVDTKFVRNMIPGQVKMTKLEWNMNILVAIVFICQVTFCVVLAIAQDKWTRDSDNDREFIPEFRDAVLHIGPETSDIAAQFGRFLILLNQLIPISLYVTLEIVKVVQSYLIDWDVQMYHAASKTHAKARTTNLNEELGQVQYVMADKTGTLTQNIMAFVQCSIGGVVYGSVQHEVGLQSSFKKFTIHTLSYDPRLTQKLSELAQGSQDVDTQFVGSFFCHLSLCHVVHPVLAKKGEDGHEEDDVIKYSGASPDEEALVQGAADCGFKLKKRAHDELLVEFPGIIGLQKFVIMAVLEFTSERKRMSIICRDSKGRIKLYCKGADSVIFKRLGRGQEDLIETSLNQLEDFARCGYRTMCMAERKISQVEYDKWAARFRAASIALDDRDEKLAAVSETIERDMMLLGVTAVEDKLQGKVPETITLLAQAGIKVWVLTGDKLETSVSVALSCNLLADSMHLFLLSDNVSKSVPELLRSMLDEARKQHNSKSKIEGSDYHSEMATVIEGSSLAVALEESNKLVFLELLQLCRSVVCCRVSPIQKAQVTLLLKDYGNSVILAIGDGANDCGMIKVAQIGVGIGGREGMAAVLASDYSLTRFRYLRRLLLVHGRWSYKRNRELVMYAIYKNIVYAMGNAYLAFYSGFSSQALYAAAEIASYNFVWTSLPTIAFAIFEKDLSDCTVENNPQLYMETQLEKRPQYFWNLFGWALCAIWDSLIAFFFPLRILSEKQGDSVGIWEFGSTVYTMAVFIVNLKIITRMHNLNCFHFIALSTSTSIWLLALFCLSFAYTLSGFFPDLQGVGEVVTRQPSFWLLLLLCPVAASLPAWTFEVFRMQQAPADFEIMREIEHGWTDGYFFPDSPDFVEQLTAPIPERRTSLEYTEDDYGPSPLQKEIADAREAILIETGSASKPQTPEEGKGIAGGGVLIPDPGKVGEKQLLPRRLTWREVVNDDELEDLGTSESLGRHGRRRSSGFQVVTRHTDSTEAILPLTHGPNPPQRKSLLFEQGGPLVNRQPSTLLARRASLKPPRPELDTKVLESDTKPQQDTKPPPQLEVKSPQQRETTKSHRQAPSGVASEDARLLTMRAKLAKHEEERRTLIGGPTHVRAPKTKRRQKIWDAVKEGSAEQDPYESDSRHPLQAMQPPGHSRSTNPTPRGVGHLPRSTRQPPFSQSTIVGLSNVTQPLTQPIHSPKDVISPSSLAGANKQRKKPPIVKFGDALPHSPGPSRFGP